MPTVSSWISPRARKGTPSAIAGRGIVAVEDIAAGEVVAVKGGHLVDTATMLAQPPRLQNSEVQIAEGLHLMALAEEEYEPVMLFRGNTVLVAMVDVTAGEELTTDYALFDGTVWPEPLRCGCGAEACRGEVTGDDWRRPDLQRRYEGWFSTYLADRIAASGTMGR